MAYTDEVRALYDQAEADFKASTTEQGNVARGQVTRRAAQMGRYGQPVAEWTYSDLEKNLAAALNTGLADLARQEAGSLAQAQALQQQKNQFDEEQNRLKSLAKLQSRDRTLQNIFGLLGAVTPYAAPVVGSAFTGLSEIFKPKQPSTSSTYEPGGYSVRNRNPKMDVTGWAPSF